MVHLVARDDSLFYTLPCVDRKIFCSDPSGNGCLDFAIRSETSSTRGTVNVSSC